MHTHRSILRILGTVSLGALLFTPALGAYRFTPGDFGLEEGGLFLTEVPDTGTLTLGDRQLSPGDVLSRSQVHQLSFSSDTQEDATICGYTLTTSGTLGKTQLTLHLKKAENLPPVAEDSTFETYKNIPGQVSLQVEDPEGDALTINLVEEPKRGTLEISPDGTITYTPLENKVGKDRFTYTVTDTAGNTSEEATVRITIRKPHDSATYSDMTGNPALLAATWLREEGLFQGEALGDTLLFGPEKAVTRGEFIALCVGLTGEEMETLETGFVDEADIPQWLLPYAATALRCGYLTGVPSENGVTLSSEEPITQAQAAKLLCGLLDLPETTETVIGETGTLEDATTVTEAAVSGLDTTDTIPAWAASSIQALEAASLTTITDPNAPLTRAQAAQLLYDAWTYHQSTPATLLDWATE